MSRASGLRLFLPKLPPSPLLRQRSTTRHHALPSDQCAPLSLSSSPPLPPRSHVHVAPLSNPLCVSQRPERLGGSVGEVAPVQ